MKVFLDCASLSDIARYNDDDSISGITTNPTLLKRAGVTDYADFAKRALNLTEKPISFEVISDDLSGMASQAKTIASWSPHAWVKIPVTNTRGYNTDSLVEGLLREGIHVNVTAVFTSAQLHKFGSAMMGTTPSIISIFAGRVSDTGVNPVPLFEEAATLFDCSNTEVLWASPRSVFDYYTAERAGADIITMTPDLIAKLQLRDYDLNAYSRDTVNQ